MAHFYKKYMILLFVSAAVLVFFFYFYQTNHSNITKETVPILKGTAAETNLLLIKSNTPGKTVFVIGGIHGDETTGWMAAEQLKNIKTLESGTLAILSTANAPGCRDGIRNVEEYRDLNRSFPGTKDRDLTDRLAASIYDLVKRLSPDIVLDLHEAGREGQGRDFLGNSLIFTGNPDGGNSTRREVTIDGGKCPDSIESLVSDLVLETESGELCTKPFSFYGPGPKGSLNREVTEHLTLLVLTIEVSKEDPQQERLENHLALIHHVLQQYGLE